jgi:15-cis-phytoene synthase
MQLTNIARDVMTDFAMNRVYLPRTWLAMVGVDAENLDRDIYRQGVFQTTARLLEFAHEYYQEGRAGLPYLGLRCALAVAAAGRIYQAIGDKIMRFGEHAWDQRIWVRLPKKLFLVVRAGLDLVTGLPERLSLPPQMIRITSTRVHP